MCPSIPPRPPPCCAPSPDSPCLPVGPGDRVLSHLLLHCCAEPRAPTQGLSHPPQQMLDVSAGCPAQKSCMQTSYVWGEMDAVVYAFFFCLLSKEQLRAASSQVLQRRSSRSSSLSPGGTSSPTQGSVWSAEWTLSWRLAVVGERQELLPRGST